MLSFILFVLLIVVLVFFMAILLPMKFYFLTSGGSDRTGFYSGRLMLFNGIAGLGADFTGGKLRVIFYLGSWQAAFFNVTSSVRKLRRRKSAKVTQESKNEPVSRKEEEAFSPEKKSKHLSIQDWINHLEKFRNYSVMALEA